MTCSSAAAGRAPGWEKTSVPPLNAISVGIEVICAAEASACSASVSTLPKTMSLLLTVLSKFSAPSAMVAIGSPPLW